MRWVGEPAIPPRFVVAPVELVYGDLPRPVAMTGLRIWGLGWKYQYERTDWIAEEELLEICGVRRSQLYEHLRRLSLSCVLRYTTKNARYLFWFDSLSQHLHPRRIRDGPSPEIRTNSSLSVVVDFPSSSEDSLTLGEKQQQQVVLSLGGGVGGGAGESGKPDWSAENRTEPSGIPDWGVRVEVLEEMGVLEPTRSELAALSWATVEYLTDWERWLDEQGEAVRVGVVITQVRAGMVAPAARDGRRQTRARRKKYEEWGILR